jgi:hypothetical protein
MGMKCHYKTDRRHLAEDRQSRHETADTRPRAAVEVTTLKLWLRAEKHAVPN